MIEISHGYFRDANINEFGLSQCPWVTFYSWKVGRQVGDDRDSPYLVLYVHWSQSAGPGLWMFGMLSTHFYNRSAHTPGVFLQLG